MWGILLKSQKFHYSLLMWDLWSDFDSIQRLKTSSYIFLNLLLKESLMPKVWVCKNPPQRLSPWSEWTRIAWFDVFTRGNSMDSLLILLGFIAWGFLLPSISGLQECCWYLSVFKVHSGQKTKCSVCSQCWLHKMWYRSGARAAGTTQLTKEKTKDSVF